MKQSPQRWQQERKNIETVANDSGEANLFMTLNMDVRFWRDVHNLLHILIHKEPSTNNCYSVLTQGHAKHSGKPCFIPDYVNDQKTFERLTDRYAAKIEEFLYFKTETFLNTWFHDVCGVPKTERPTKSDLYDTVGGTIWRRVEYTRSRGIQHWHILAKLPGVMHLPSLMRLLNRGRQARLELHKRNIQPQHIQHALQHVRVGLLAGRYLSDYADSLVHMDFHDINQPSCQQTNADVDCIQQVSHRFNTVLRKARCGEAPLTPDKLPILNKYCHIPGDLTTDHKRMADIAAFSCIHNCITTACGGDANGNKCRFGFPRKKMPVTVLGTVCANDDFVETHVYHKRTTTRTSNTNKWALLYWGANHDFQTIMNFSQINRYATKYVTKHAHSDALTHVLQEIISDEDAFVRLTREGALIQAFTTANQYRSDLTRHQLFYLALGLPESLSNFSVSPASIIMKAELKTEVNEHGVEVPVDLLEKSLIYAYAERRNCKNDPSEFPGGINKITLYDFLRVVKKHAWVDKNGKATEKGYKNRDPKSGNQWYFTFEEEGAAKHIRILNLKQTELAKNYSFEENEGIPWENMTWESKSMLYRAHQELTLFVPWDETVDKTFLSPETYTAVNILSDENNEIKKMRMEAFMHVYKEYVQKGLVAKPGTPWQRQNQYLHSMWLSNKVNKSIRENRADNNGVFSATFVPGNPDQHLLDEANATVYEFADQEAPLYELPEKGLEFELAMHLKNLRQKTLQDIHVANGNAEFWQKQQSHFAQKQDNSFLANPPTPNITVANLTTQQHFAYTQATRQHGPKVLYITGLAGTGKSAVAKLIYKKVTESGHTCQVAAATAKAASQFNAPTFHGAMGLSPMTLMREDIISTTTLRKLQTLYNAHLPQKECTHFIIDEVNALSADLLAAAEAVLRKVFNKDGEDHPWGNRTMIFLGDPLQLPPVKGVNLISIDDEDEEDEPADEEDRRGRWTRVKKSKNERIQQNVAIGQALFKKHLEKNVVIFDKCHRSTGLLPRIMDEVRNARTTVQSHQMIMHLATKFVNAPYDKGIYNDNHSRELMNMVQTLQDAETAQEPLYVSFANYAVKNRTTERFMRALKPQDFSSPVDDLLLLYRGMEVALVKNLNTKAGLTNGTVGTVVAVCYDQKDVQPLLEGHHPQPYCVIVDFPEFKGFEDRRDKDQETTSTSPQTPSDIEDAVMYAKRFKFPVPTWVAIYPTDNQLEMPRTKQSRAMFTKSDKKCRTQFPIVPAKNMTAHKSQGQTWPDCVLNIALGLKQISKPTSATTTLLYTAGTRSNRLKNCLFDHIPLDTWLNLGKNNTHQALLRYEQQLRENAKKYADKNGKHNIYLDLNTSQPSALTADQEAEWAEILAMTEMPQYNTTRPLPSLLIHQCSHITQTSTISNAIIAFDLGPKNTGVAVLTKPTESTPTSQLLDLRHINFGLPPVRPDNWQVELYTKLCDKLSFLRTYFHDTKYDHLTSWSIVVEYFNTYNSYTGSMLHTIERIVNEFQVGTTKTVTIKACNTQMVHSSKSPIFNLNFTNDELRYLRDEIDLHTLQLLKQTVPAAPQNDIAPDDIPEPFESDEDNDVHMDTSDKNEPNTVQTPTTNRPQKRKSEPLPPEIPTKRVCRETTRKTKGKYRSQKDHSKRLMQLIASDVDLAHLTINIPLHIQKYLKELKSKLDDIGDAFLHACREAYAEPSMYRTFVPGQTLFQTNRCVAIRITVRWCLFIVLHVQDHTVTVEHLQCRPTGITQALNLNQLTEEDIKKALPQTLRNFMNFEHKHSSVQDADTIHFVLRHTHGSLPHVMLQHLKLFMKNLFENHADYTSTTNHAGPTTTSSTKNLSLSRKLLENILTPSNYSQHS
jgi:hypothetical protein